MKSRLFDRVKTKERSVKADVSNPETINFQHFSCLEEKDVITAQVSDHQPMVHAGVLFWNIMMRGNKRLTAKTYRYNNGFGIVETDEEYINRLAKVAQVITEIIHRCPSIEVITLCEGPIEKLYMDKFLQSLKHSPAMTKFFSANLPSHVFHKPMLNNFSDWGLLMLADKSYKVNLLRSDISEYSMWFSKLANRLQLWELEKNGIKKYVALAHLPFGGDVHVTKKENLSVDGNVYCRLVNNMLNKYANEDFILCADFNFNPHLLSQLQDRVLDKISNNNSVLISAKEQMAESVLTTVTVDGILLSAHEKRRQASLRFNHGLFSRLAKEDDLLSSTIKHNLSGNKDHRKALSLGRTTSKINNNVRLY